MMKWLGDWSSEGHGQITHVPLLMMPWSLFLLTTVRASPCCIEQHRQQYSTSSVSMKSGPWLVELQTLCWTADLREIRHAEPKLTVLSRWSHKQGRCAIGISFGRVFRTTKRVTIFFKHKLMNLSNSPARMATEVELPNVIKEEIEWPLGIKGFNVRLMLGLMPLGSY